jgi:hypothetical protein
MIPVPASTRVWLAAGHLMAACFRCQHQERLTVAVLTWERPPHAYLSDLERKLRCTRCGNRQGNTLSRQQGEVRFAALVTSC